MSETGGMDNGQVAAAASGQGDNLTAGNPGAGAGANDTAASSTNELERELAAALDTPEDTAAPKPEDAAGKKDGGKAGKEDGKPAGRQDGKKDKPGDGGDKSGDGDGKSDEAAKQWEGLAAHIPPEAGIDPAIVESFAGAAKEMGLNPEQAKKLIDWQLNAVAQANARKVEQGMAALQKEWGANTQANLDQALQLVTAIDRAMGNENFSKSLGLYGIACDADFVRGLSHIAKLIGEDSLGARASNAHAFEEETPLEGLRKLFK